jgi:glycosyltransferase involved in cell wall biosynthesis
MHSMYVYMALALAGSRIPLVASEHVGTRHFIGRPLQRMLVGVLDRLLVAKTVPSVAVQAEHARVSRCRIVVLPNPVAMPAPGRAPTVNEAPIVLCVGGFRPEKDQATLVRAFADVANGFPEWRLRMVGDGELRPELEALIAALRLGDRVQMPGVVRDIAAEYEQAALAVVPSVYESFGMATVEALGAARPVIAFSDCAATSELVEDGTNGLLVDPGRDRAAGLAAALRRLMADAPLRHRLGANGPRVAARFERESVLDAWEKFLLEQAARA